MAPESDRRAFFRWLTLGGLLGIGALLAGRGQIRPPQAACGSACQGCPRLDGCGLQRGVHHRQLRAGGDAHGR